MSRLTLRLPKAVFTPRVLLFGRDTQVANRQAHAPVDVVVPMQVRQPQRRARADGADLFVCGRVCECDGW